MGEYSVNNPLFGWIEGPWRFKKFHPSHSPLARASCLWAHAPISPLRLQVLRLRVRRSASPPGVSHCGLPPAGDLSGLQARHLRTQRRPGLPGPRPAAGKLRGSGLVGGEVPAGLGHQGTALWTKRREWALRSAGRLLAQSGWAEGWGRGREGAPVGGAWRPWGLTWGQSGRRAESRAGRTKGHRERFGLIYPESGRKLAGFHAGM